MTERNNKGQFIKILTDAERKRRAAENSKKWALQNKERRREIDKRSRARPESKKRNAELKRKRYYEGLDIATREKYIKSEKGVIAKKRAATKWAKNNPEKIIEKERELRNKLSDCYIMNKLKRGTNLTSKQIRETPELIEAARLLIKTKRLCKTSQNSEQV